MPGEGRGEKDDCPADVVKRAMRPKVGALHGKLAASCAVVPTEREVSLPFVPPSPGVGPAPVVHGERPSLSRRAAAVLEDQADDIAGRWDARMPAPMSTTTSPRADAPDSSRAAHAAAVVRSLATALGSGDGASEDLLCRGAALGTAAFNEGLSADQLLHTLTGLEALSLAAIETAIEQEAPSSADAAEGIRLGRRVQQAFANAAIAAMRSYAQAANTAMQERFRRLRHDLRNPLGTIKSALELMGDESIPEEARRGPRFHAMIERNTVAMDQMIVTRLGDGEAQLLPATSRDATSALVPSESRDDVGGARQGDDRQPGPL